jgi:hypothetical protein
MPSAAYPTPASPSTTPSHIERLLAEQAELRAILRLRPPDRRPAFRQAELALASAKKDLYWANYRLEAAENRLGELRPLSRLRRPSRKENGSVLDEIGRFTDDVRKAEAKIVRCERSVEELRPELDQPPQWDAEHDRPESRLRAVEGELGELARPASLER